MVSDYNGFQCRYFGPILTTKKISSRGFREVGVVLNETSDLLEVIIKVSRESIKV